MQRGCACQDPEMKTQSSIFLLLLFLGITQAAITMQENLDQIATEVVEKVDQVVDKVEESKEKCYKGSHYLVDVICEARIDWWDALITWLRSLGGSKGICDILQRLQDFTNSLIHLVHCNLSSNPDPECSSSRTFLTNQLAWLNEQDVANTDQLSLSSKALLVVVVIFFHLALSSLILALILPFTSYCFSGVGAKVEKAFAMTRRTRSTSTRWTSSTRRSRSTRRTHSSPSDAKLTLSTKA